MAARLKATGPGEAPAPDYADDDSMPCSLRARCSRCGGELRFGQLAEESTGWCSWCGVDLCPDSGGFLLREVLRADNAYGQLIQSLRNLTQLPGDLAVAPESILRGLLAWVPWEDALASDPTLAAPTAALLRQQAATWSALAGQIEATVGANEVRRWRRGGRAVSKREKS